MEQATAKTDLLPLAQRYALTLEQASHYVSLSVPTLRGACRRGELPFNRRGRKILIRRSDLEKWVTEGL